MFGYCNKKMQARIKESPDFETKIQNDPIESLKSSRLKCVIHQEQSMSMQH